MRVYERLADAFNAEGAAPVFGMMGDYNVHWIDALDKLGIPTYEVRHEGAGLAMADGWARVSGGVGVCSASGGPGVAQFSTTMLVASRARTPLVVYAGSVDLTDDEHPQRLDYQRFADAMEAAYVRLVSPDQTDEAVRKAFYLARLESRPVMFDVPLNVQKAVFDDGDERYLPSTDVLRPQPVAPNPERLREAVDIVASARKPVLVLGRGAIWSGAGDAAVKLADRIGALLATTLMAKTWLNDHPFHVGISGLYATRTAIELLQEADCVIGVGASLNYHTTEHGYLYPNAKYVHLDIKPHVLTSGVRSADCYVQADARIGLEALEQELASRGVTSTGYRTPDVQAKLEHNFDDFEPFDIPEGTVDTRDVCRAVDECVPYEANLVLGGGHGIQIATMLCNRQHETLLCNQHFGCIGQGITTAIGALLATDRRPTVLVEGDAGYMMHAVEFETAARYGLALMVVVLNDEGLGAEYHRMGPQKLQQRLATIDCPDLGAVGRAFGGRGALARSIEEVTAALRAFVADPAPTILDVRVARGVLSLPYRRVLEARNA